ncbi:MAG: isopenicillin N synthase family dioxygenase [Candidatus Promineifilaceae bacterium]
MTHIPIIDLTPYFDGSDKAGVAQQIGRACEEIGFFTISGHGISLDQIVAANAAAGAFFDRGLSAKHLLKRQDGMGYLGPDGENLAASLDDAQVVDVKESLNLTLPIVDGMWPVSAELRQESGAYFTQLIALARDLMRLFALALELPEDWFEDKIDDARTILRLLNYPAISAETSPSRAGAHTDYGTLTILWSPDSRGLQAQSRSGEWVNVVAPPEHFIINIGDLMMNWTNDRWISTLHRVVRHPDTAGKRRQSIAFFHNPNPDALIACIDSCQDVDNPPKYPPLLAKEHLEMKIAKSLGQTVKL